MKCCWTVLLKICICSCSHTDIWYGYFLSIFYQYCDIWSISNCYEIWYGHFQFIIYCFVLETVYPRDPWMNTANQWPFSSPFPSTNRISISRISRQPKQAAGAGTLWQGSSAWESRPVVAGAIQCGRGRWPLLVIDNGGPYGPPSVWVNGNPMGRRGPLSGGLSWAPHGVAKGGSVTFMVSLGPPVWTATAAQYELPVGWSVQRRDAAYNGRRPFVAGAWGRTVAAETWQEEEGGCAGIKEFRVRGFSVFG